MSAVSTTVPALKPRPLSPMNARAPAASEYTSIGIDVRRMSSPSRPTSPTVAEAATTLCTATILPAAPPTA